MSENQQTDNDPGNDLGEVLGFEPVTLRTGESVHVREFGAFMEGIKVDAIARPIIQSLQDLFLQLERGHDFKLQDISAVFGAHEAATAELLAMACDRETAWVESLKDADGQLVLMAFWRANHDFFTRRLLAEGLSRVGISAIQASPGPSSLPG